MAKKLKIWYDKEGDYLELLFSDEPGYMKPSTNDSIMERVDENGNILGYSILGLSKMKMDSPLNAEFEFA